MVSRRSTVERSGLGSCGYSDTTGRAIPPERAFAVFFGALLRWNGHDDAGWCAVWGRVAAAHADRLRTKYTALIRIQRAAECLTITPTSHIAIASDGYLSYSGNYHPT